MVFEVQDAGGRRHPAFFMGGILALLWGGSLFYDVRGGFGAPFGILIQRWFHSNEGKASWGGMDFGG